MIIDSAEGRAQAVSKQLQEDLKKKKKGRRASPRSSSDPPNLDSDKVLDELDVLAAVLGEVLVLGDGGNARLPPRELDVLHLNLGEVVEVGGEVRVDGLAVEVVRNGDLERREVVEDVKFREVERRVAVDEVRVLEDDKVEPATPAAATGRDAELLPDLLEVNSNLLRIRKTKGQLMDFPYMGKGDRR